MKRSAEIEVRHQATGEADKGHHGDPRRDRGGPPTTFAGDEHGEHNDERRDEGRDEMKQGRTDPDQQHPERVEDRVHGPERVDRQGPAVQGEMTCTHRLTFEHDRRAVRVACKGVS